MCEDQVTFLYHSQVSMQEKGSLKVRLKELCPEAPLVLDCIGGKHPGFRANAVRRWPAGKERVYFAYRRNVNNW